jgi:hypothetical protein
MAFSFLQQKNEWKRRWIEALILKEKSVPKK